MKRVGMLVVLLKGVNFGFWSHLGCSGQNAITFSPEGLVQGCIGLHLKKYKNIYLICIILIRSIYFIHIIQVFSFACVLTGSLLGIKNSLDHAQIGLLQGFNSKFPIPTPYICGVPRPPTPPPPTLGLKCETSLQGDAGHSLSGMISTCI